MSRGAGATQEKRRRERAKAEKKEEKARDRVVRKEQRKLNADGSVADDGEDPDLIGIVAGPQPIIED
jgi:hypothetical protein